MLIILYSALFSYLLFLTLCIAPLINSELDRKNSSKLLRKVFPRNFIFGGTLSFILLSYSILQKNSLSIVFAFIILIFYLINLYFILPKINKEADSNNSQKNYSRKFKKLHLYSVLLYILQIILSLTAITIFIN